MQVTLNALTGRELILDLGCCNSGFDTQSGELGKIRADLRSQGAMPGAFVVKADPARLPFRPGSFDTVCCSYTRPQLAELKAVLRQIGDLIKPEGALFVAVPDATSLAHRVLRWLFHGKEQARNHDSAAVLAELMSSCTGLRHVATRILCTSFFFLNRRNARGAAPWRLVFFLWGVEGPLLLLTGFLRLLDRHFHTHTSVYGWGFFLGSIHGPVCTKAWTNVCIRCGCGYPSEWLRSIQAVSKRWGFLPMYRCPHCGAANIYSRDEDYGRLQVEPATRKSGHWKPAVQELRPYAPAIPSPTRRLHSEQ